MRPAVWLCYMQYNECIGIKDMCSHHPCLNKTPPAVEGKIPAGVVSYS